ncbi:LysR family transcriptional regulator [Chromobacterium sp. ATCC 53434]|uniref:LysR family transcriptional regulator n=1 Tax=Chromobacterium sp. (strain ATCC 53434 / SC 14030) TaxID=2059672 RepID=UPI000C75CF99|nr:LysR family transcriptional regulator [Chromobacterium sp. ATCC 53434]AUH49426.1 LysR family transcriptional regulator [Chromobacterium sp. ATCC 53434]
MARGVEGNLEGLQIFVAVAEAGGFTAAAERLGMTKANVSLQVGRLETQLGATLFTRTTRRVKLTEAGQALYLDAQPALAALRDALLQAGHGAAALSGTLRLTAPVSHMAESVAPAATQFIRQHPGLQLELHASDRMVDLVADGMDLAIRLGMLRDSSLRALKLGEFAQQLVASPAYLRERGMPGHPAELSGHDWVALTLLKTPLTWRFSGRDGAEETVRTRARIKVDSAASLRSLLLAGAGVSVLDSFSVQEDLRQGRLVHLLPQWTLAKGGVYAVFPPGRHAPAAARAFVEFYRVMLARPA